MVWAYSCDLRDRVLASVDEGMPVYHAAALYRVSVSFIYKLRARREQTGQTAPSATKGHRPRKLAGHLESLRGYIQDQDDATLHEIQEWLAGRGVSVSIGALWSTLEREGFSYKNNRSCRRTGA